MMNENKLGKPARANASLLERRVMPKVLYLILKKRWFDMIATGEKKEEYREMKPYWEKRLCNKSFDFVVFRNGYAKNAPTITKRVKSITTGVGKLKWGAPMAERVFIIELGETVEA